MIDDKTQPETVGFFVENKALLFKNTVHYFNK
jgi:hypothetical protein